MGRIEIEEECDAVEKTLTALHEKMNYGKTRQIKYEDRI
jgi:hypothetical protein